MADIWPIDGFLGPYPLLAGESSDEICQ